MKYFKGNNRYYALDGGQEIAEVTYSVAGEKILIIDHTEVDNNYRGKGIAQALVKLVVDQAIREEKKIVPLCPFAAKEFHENPDYKKIKN